MVLLLTRETAIPKAKNDGHLKDVARGMWYEATVLEAERYGLLQADALGFIRPDAEVTRAEFLKMMAYTFGLPENLPHRYRDVAAADWYAPFAGIAAQYELFPMSRVTPRLSPGNFLTTEEASAAIQALLDHRGKNFPSLQALADTRHRAAAHPRLLISNTQEEVTVLRAPAPPKPRRDPLPVLRPVEPSIVVFDPAKIADLRTQILRLVNAKRRAVGAKSLTLDDHLTGSAQAYAETMAAENFFAHVSPLGQTLKERIEAFGYYLPFYSGPCSGKTDAPCERSYVLGENLAQGQKTIDQVMTDWMNSPEHRRAMLSPSFQDIGIGIAAGYWVQHFGGVR